MASPSGRDTGTGQPKAGPVLVVRFGALGDLVQFSAILGAVADHHGRPVDVLTGGGAPALALAGMPEVGRFYSLAHRRRPLWLAPDRLWLQRALTARGHGEVYCFNRLGHGLERFFQRRGAILHDGMLDRPGHALDNAREALWRLGIAVPGPLLPRVVASAAERAAAHTLLRAHGVAGRPLLVVQPGSSRTLHPLHRLRPARNLKAWPLEHWVAVLTAIAARHPEAALALLGAPSEAGINDDILRALPPDVRARSANLARDLPVRTLAGVLAGAAGCLAVDTGPAHLAAALGCPLVVLFGPADPGEMAPRGPAPVEVVVSGAACSPCHGTPRRQACRENVCMKRIGVAQALAAWERCQAAARPRSVSSA